jgi:hypothetical protein
MATVLAVFAVLALALGWSRSTRWMLVVPLWVVGLVGSQYLKVWIWTLAGGTRSDGSSSDSFLPLIQQGPVAAWFKPLYWFATTMLVVVILIGTVALVAGPTSTRAQPIDIGDDDGDARPPTAEP